MAWNSPQIDLLSKGLFFAKIILTMYCEYIIRLDASQDELTWYPISMALTAHLILYGFAPNYKWSWQNKFGEENFRCAKNCSGTCNFLSMYSWSLIPLFFISGMSRSFTKKTIK